MARELAVDALGGRRREGNSRASGEYSDRPLVWWASVKYWDLKTDTGSAPQASSLRRT